MKREGQAWGLDLMVAATLFMISISVFYLYARNQETSESSSIKEARFEADLIADSLMSEGVPKDWNKNSVVKIGMLSNGKINETKLAEWYAMSLEDYEQTKNLFGTRYEYFVNFSEQIIIEENAISGIGHVPEASAEKTLNVARFSSYIGKPITIEVVAWKQE